MSISVTQETINPKQAEALLGVNVINRNLRPVVVDAIARDIESGSWQMNGESIKIASDGSLIDGQHRLAAVVQANKPITTVVVRGLSPETQATIDAGIRRQFRDMLTLVGETGNTLTLASIVRADYFLTKFGFPNPFVVSPTNAELYEHFQSDKDGFRTSLPIGVQAGHSKLKIAASVAGSVHHQMRTIDPALADEFWRRLLENDMPKNSAIFGLRESLIRDLGRPHRMGLTPKAATIIKAWNYWIDGREADHISWRASGPTSENFPKLKAPVKEVA